MIKIQELLLGSKLHQRRQCQEAPPDSPRMRYDRKDIRTLDILEHAGGLVQQPPVKGRDSGVTTKRK